MQILRTDRLQKEGLLIQLGITAKIRCNGTFQAVQTCNGEIEIIPVFRVLDTKGSIFIGKVNSLHTPS